mgnify:CR=1 FL=1
MKGRGEGGAGSVRRDPARSTSEQTDSDPERPALALTAGDPSGIGPEIVLKALADERSLAARIIVLGDARNLRRTSRDLRLRWPFAGVLRQPPRGRRWDRPVLLDLHDAGGALVPGQVSAEGGRAAADAIEKGAELALSGVVDGIVTAPVHKEALSLAGVEDMTVNATAAMNAISRSAQSTASSSA